MLTFCSPPNISLAHLFGDIRLHFIVKDGVHIQTLPMTRRGKGCSIVVSGRDFKTDLSGFKVVQNDAFEEVLDNLCLLCSKRKLGRFEETNKALEALERRANL